MEGCDRDGGEGDLIDLTGHILGHIWTLECSLKCMNRFFRSLLSHTRDMRHET